METEELILIFASLMFFFDLIQLSKVKPGEKRKLRYGFYAITLACGLIFTSYLMLVQAFLNDNFLLREVYSYSSSGLSTTYKLYATWGGASGSMLFLTFLTGILYFVYRFKADEKRGAFNIVAYKILDFILIFFLIVTLMDSPFERFSAAPMDGRGLNPLLQTFWMIIHPPVTFLGYVFVIFVFVLSLANMKTQESQDDRVFRLLLQAAWLTTSLGIAIGGLWAYEVLGWGGYWAWDPVETASLLPWLALTAYFHLGAREKRESLAGELMLLIAFSTVVLATTLTRGGLLVSVHAFGASPIGPVLLLFASGAIIYFFSLKFKIKKPLYTFQIEKSSLFSISLFVGFWSLIFLLLVSFWGVAFPLILGIFGERVRTGAEFYNNWSFPFTLAFVAALVGCNLSNKFGIRKYVALIFGAVFAGAILVIATFPTPNVLANFGLPLLFLALAITGYRLIRSLLKIRRSFRLFGRSILHFAIVVILIGVFVSSTTKQASGNILAKPNTTIETLGLRIELGDVTIYNGTGNIYLVGLGQNFPEYSALKMDVAIRQGGSIYHGVLWIRLYKLYDIVCQPLIITTLTGDIYVHMHHTVSVYKVLQQALLVGTKALPEDLIISVEIIPMVHLVWAGIILLGIGITISLIEGTIRLAQKKESLSKK